MSWSSLPRPIRENRRTFGNQQQFIHSLISVNQAHSLAPHRHSRTPGCKNDKACCCYCTAESIKRQTQTEKYSTLSIERLLCNICGIQRGNRNISWPLYRPQHLLLSLLLWISPVIYGFLYSQTFNFNLNLPSGVGVWLNRTSLSLIYVSGSW